MDWVVYAPSLWGARGGLQPDHRWLGIQAGCRQSADAGNFRLRGRGRYGVPHATIQGCGDNCRNFVVVLWATLGSIPALGFISVWLVPVSPASSA